MSVRRWFKRRASQVAATKWTPILAARQHEAEMVATLLVAEGIPAYVRILDVSNVPALGVCQVCVPDDRVVEARALADPMATGEGGWE